MNGQNALVLAVASLIVLPLTSCAQGLQGSSSNDAVDVAAVEAQADEIYLQIWGTGAQKEAEHYLSFMKLNQPTSDCMDEKNFDFQPSFAYIWADWSPNSTESSGWMGKLGWVPPVATDGERKPLMPVDPERGPDSPGYQEALDSCISQPGGAPAGNPVGAQELSDAFHRLMADVDDELGSIAPYQECMAEAGVEVSENGVSGLMAVLASRGKSDDDEDFAQTASSADIRCREHQYTRGLALLAPALDEFQRENGVALAAAETAWTATLDRAKDQGFVSVPG